ncbi:LysM peptidoglycan-binding domain-containing protein [Rhizobium sp. TRM95796]|uniref:LysM peptidoglycan-binding domain-containing protein n=1 Tax=Rhizobium sp. TRM95796 TaxID=2979862 RepID=UPI0021E85848|nr:LysM peptidoglycan-binding domain-containing protein [Rhizobium sp. TRM95796]MCV3765483.1 LysM peptidoglycan-binding domain-containing protein [Rhizobium sp. TRM95796]
MKRSRAILVALIVLVVASLLMFLVVLPNSSAKKDAEQLAETAKSAAEQVVASAKTSMNDISGGATTEPPATEAAKTEAPAEPAKTAPQNPDTPSFDVLRVEPDGSTVIAGRAAPNADVAVSDGEKVISTVKAGATGDFAVVLDEPLPAGDHQLVLQAKGTNGKAVTSQEVATISVPKDNKGELLAMVSKPGEASRIMTMPEAAPPEAKVDAPAATETKPAQQTQTAAAETPSAVIVQKNATASASAALDPEVQVSAVEIEGDKLFVAGKAPKSRSVRVYADDKLVAEVKVNEKGRFVADNTMPLSVGDHTIRADVLSADGARVEFRASVPFFRPEGAQMAAVAGESGGAATSPMQPLAFGVYDKAREEAGKAIDLLKGQFANGRTPSAEELAAARSATEIALKSLADIKTPDNVDPVAQEMAAKTAGEAAKALALLKALPQNATDVQAALDKIDDAVTSATGPAIETAAAQPAKAVEQKTPPAVEAASADPKQAIATAEKPAPTAEQDGEPTANAAEAAAKTAQAPAATETKPASIETAAQPAVTPETKTAAAEGEPKVIQQAPLQHSESSVIIRRGDTLWQISRRVYGQGVRYTTIYLANEAQIEDPDRILPGQIFGVPDKPLDNAEEIHRKRLGLQ